jgi:multidrug efflux pump subunit AcrB
VETKSLILLAVGALGVVAWSNASQPPIPVVSIHYSVNENDPEHLQTAVTIPVERVIQKIERVAKINTSTSHGTVDVEVQFKGEVTKQDLSTIISQIELLTFGDKMVIISRTVELRPPRLSNDTVQNLH